MSRQHGGAERVPASAQAKVARAQTRKGTAAMTKAVALLDLVAMAGEPPTFAELARSSGLPRGTLHRLITGLVQHGMIMTAPSDHRYLPGYHLLELARRTWESSDLRRAAAGPILELNRRTGETVHVATLSDDSVIYIDKVECDYPLRLHSAIGKRGPVHCTAVGKVMAAYLESVEQRDLVARLDLRRHTTTTLTSRTALLKALAAIRGLGVAFDREEHVTGIHCVAAPLFDYRGRCVGGISITAPVARVDARQLAGFSQLVREAAAEASGRLGGVLKASAA